MGVPAKAATLAVTMVDEDVLGHHQRPHWVMWNIDPRDRIPGHILPGKHVTEIMGPSRAKFLVDTVTADPSQRGYGASRTTTYSQFMHWITACRYLRGPITTTLSTAFVVMSCATGR